MESSSIMPGVWQGWYLYEGPERLGLALIWTNVFSISPDSVELYVGCV